MERIGKERFQSSDAVEGRTVQVISNRGEFGDRINYAHGLCCQLTLSLSASSADVASSSKRIFGFRRSARAMATRCFWPPDNFPPFAPTLVEYPCKCFALINSLRNHIIAIICQWLLKKTSLPKLNLCESFVLKARFKVRLDWTRSNAKQPKFDVIDSSRKVATGRNLREQLHNSACLQAVVR